MSSRDFIKRGGGWVVAQNILMTAALVLAPLFRGPRAGVGQLIVGAVLCAVGGWMGIAGVHALGRSLTPYPKPLEDSTLVRTGVYGVVRHPLYSSLIFLSIGWTVLWASWPGLTLVVALILVLNAKALREERWLRERYPDYGEYERRVKRFIPGLW